MSSEWKKWVKPGSCELSSGTGVFKVQPSVGCVGCCYRNQHAKTHMEHTREEDIGCVHMVDMCPSMVDSRVWAKGRKTAESDVDTPTSVCFIVDLISPVRPRLLGKLPVRLFLWGCNWVSRDLSVWENTTDDVKHVSCTEMFIDANKDIPCCFIIGCSWDVSSEMY